jgi:hypothetical protein
MKDALFQPGNMSLDTQKEWHDPHAVDDVFCHSHSVHLQRAANASEKRHQDRVLVGEFVDFVRSENPENLSTLEEIAVTSTLEEAARTVENTGADFRRAYQQLRKLGVKFLSRKARPRFHEGTITEQRAPETNACTDENGRQVQTSSLFWNRIELYNEVWSQPLVKLSSKYGISDVRLGKVCRRLKIPHPGRGYWARRAVGQNVEQVALPEFNGAPVVRRMKTKNAARLDKAHSPGSRTRVCGCPTNNASRTGWHFADKKAKRRRNSRPEDGASCTRILYPQSSRIPMYFEVFGSSP